MNPRQWTFGALGLEGSGSEEQACNLVNARSSGQPRIGLGLVSAKTAVGLELAWG